VREVVVVSHTEEKVDQEARVDSAVVEEAEAGECEDNVDLVELALVMLVANENLNDTVEATGRKNCSPCFAF